MNTVLLVASLGVIGLAALALTVKTKLDQAWAGGFRAGFLAAQQATIGDERRGSVKNSCLLPPKDGYSRTYEDALRLATQAHRGQNRKGCDVPYITHPVQVSLILAAHGFPIEVVIAGLLHDVVEDCGYEPRQIVWVSTQAVRPSSGPRSKKGEMGGSRAASPPSNPPPSSSFCRERQLRSRAE